MDLITEADSGLSFHLQKLAVLTETLAVNHGSAVLPLSVNRDGFAALIEQINDGKDFRDYVLDFSSKVPERKRYSAPNAPPEAGPSAGGLPLQQGPGVSQLPEIDAQFPGRVDSMQSDARRVSASFNGSSSLGYAPPVTYPNQAQPPSTFTASPPATYSSHSQPQIPPPTAAIAAQSPGPVTIPSPTDQGNSNPNTLAPPSIQPTPTSAFIPPVTYPPASPTQLAQPPTASQPPPASQPQPLAPQVLPNNNTLPYTPSSPRGATFGVPIEDLLLRENSTLPFIMGQCVMAIDQFGLHTEGIYRVSGSASNLVKLKRMFDFEPERVDFRTPAGFFGDVHSVAGILKQFLRELPEPLLTRRFRNDFIQVARMAPSEHPSCAVLLMQLLALEPDFHRRDAIHSLINDLPDANYSCIRMLALHLHKCPLHA